MGKFSHQAADEFCEAVMDRIKGTDWRYVQGYNHQRFFGVVAKKDVKPPTSQDVMEGKYPDHYYSIVSHDFESFQIGVNTVLKKLEL